MSDLLTTPLDKLTFTDVIDFCKQGAVENIRLDYKRQFSDTAQIAKLASAFANTQGGTIIYGVDVGSDKRRPELNPKGQNLGNDPQAKVTSVCTTNIYPPLAVGISDYLRNPSDASIGFMVVRVPASDAVHTVDGRSGIYIRQNDQSEPVPATIEMIDFLLRRKHNGMELQEKRRDEALRRLRSANINAARPGTVWVSIGPQLTIEPLIELREIKRIASEVSVPSRYFGGRKSPVHEADDIRGTFDGVYSVDRNSSLGGSIDIFGNMTLFSNFLEGYSLTTDWANESLRAQKLDGKPACLDARLIVERVLVLLEAAKNLYAKSGFVGIVSLRISFQDVLRTCLVFHSDRGPKLLGLNECDQNLTFEEIVVSTELKNDSQQLLRRFVDRLLLAWGQTDIITGTPFIIDLAEQIVHRYDNCPICRSNRKPSNRDKCLDCRK